MASDLQLESSEVEIEDQDDHVDVEAKDEEWNVKEVEVLKRENSQSVEEDEEGKSTKPIIQPMFKIRVKLPASNAYRSNQSWHCYSRRVSLYSFQEKIEMTIKDQKWIRIDWCILYKC